MDRFEYFFAFHPVIHYTTMTGTFDDIDYGLEFWDDHFMMDGDEDSLLNSFEEDTGIPVMDNQQVNEMEGNLDSDEDSEDGPEEDSR